MLAAAFAVAFALPACAKETARPLVIESTPVKLSLGEEPQRRIGRLLFRGSLRLKSPDKDFGGMSGLVVSQDRTRFLAVTDESHWITGTLSYTDGKLTGAEGAKIAPILDPDGKPLEGKDGDAESLAQAADGTAYVGFERDHRIWRYDIGKYGLAAKARAVGTPSELDGAPANGGLEGITLLHDGRLLALTEEFEDSAGNFRGWLLSPNGVRKSEALALRPRVPFKLTDVRELPGGDVLTLERRFSRIGGVGFEMRRIPAAQVAAGAVLDGEILADAGMAYVIDNMEGLSVNKGENGETLIYLCSDDNFNPRLQQTLLMMFELAE